MKRERPYPPISPDSNQHCRAVVNARKCLEENLDLIRSVLRSTALSRGVRGEERDEFEQYVMVKLLDNELAILRKFRGDSALKTFMTVVVQRLLLDFRNHRWGRWRPSAKARRLGRHAVQLERMVNRDGRTIADSVAALQADPWSPASEAVLEALVGQLALRPRRRMESDEGLESMPASDRADQRVRARERGRWVLQVQAALIAAMLTLPEEDQFLVRLRYLDGWTVPQIARLFELPTKALYRHYDRQLKSLRCQMQTHGVAWARVEAVLGRSETELDLGGET